MAKKTRLKPAETDHTQDVINDAIEHAEMKQADDDRAKAEDEALKKRGEAIDAEETRKQIAAEKAHQRAVDQFAAICSAIQVRDQIVAHVRRLLINSRTIDLESVIRLMVYHGHDPALAKIAIMTANELEIIDGYIRERR